MDAIKRHLEHLDRTGWKPWQFGLLLLGLLLAAFPQVLLGTHSFFYRDFGVLAYPFIEYQRDCFWRGELPLWNPYSNCGAPFLAQWGTMTLYPGSLLYLLLPLPWSLSLFCFLHLILGGTGIYILARRWVGDGLPAAVAGTAFIFSGTVFSCLLWPNYTVALGWMPWVIGLVERSWREGGRWLVAAALAGTMQMLAGVPELGMLTWLLLGGLWAGACLAKETAGSRWTLTWRLAVVGLLVAALSAVQLLPFLELLGQSQRDAAFATGKWPMPAWGLGNLLVPLFHTRPTLHGPHFQPGQEFFSSYYPGAAILVLALLGACWARERRAWILGGLVVFAVLMAWGENSPFYPLARRVFPPLGLARYPVKFLLLAAFALPVLAAWGVRSLAATRPTVATRHSTLVVAGFGALLAMAALAGWAWLHPYQSAQWSPEDNALLAREQGPFVTFNALGRAAALAACLGLLLAWARAANSWQRGLAHVALLLALAMDMITHMPAQNPSLPASVYQAGLWEENNRRPVPGLGDGRVLVSPGAEQRLLHSTVPDTTHDFLGKRLALWSNLNLLDRVPKVNGSSTLQLREQAQVQNLIYKGTNAPPRPLLQMLGVNLFSPAENPTLWVPLSNACPIVSAGQAPLYADETARLQGLASRGFDPHTQVYLRPEDRARVGVHRATDARITNALVSRGKVSAVVHATEPSLVVMAQSWSRGWRATVDGQPVPLLQANHAFQAVQVPAGQHELRLIYRDQSLLAGAGLTLLGLLACGWLWLRPGRPAASRMPASPEETPAVPPALAA